MENYYKELPHGYRRLGVFFDIEDKKKGILLNGIGMAFLFISIIAIYLSDKEEIRKCFEAIRAYHMLIFSALTIVYMYLHELTHGLAYKMFIHGKIKIGFKGLYAYCSVPDVFISRRVNLIALFSPLTVFSVVGIALVIIFKSSNMLINYYLSIFFVVIHLSGCVGDIYLIGLFLTKYRDSNLLTKDEGMRSILYYFDKNYDETFVSEDEQVTVDITDDNGVNVKKKKSKGILSVLVLLITSFVVGLLVGILEQ